MFAKFKKIVITEYYNKDTDAYITVQVRNEQPAGTLVIDKSVAIRENVDKSLVDISDLSGIEFKLIAKEKIIDYADGTTIYEKGQEVKRFNLDKDGNYTLTELPMGIYELVETKTLNGLVLNKTKYEVKFEQKDLIKKVYEETRQIKNDTTITEFSKTDITGQKELEGAKLTVIDKDGNVIDTWISGEVTHKIEGLTAGETYILREEICPNGFVKSTDISFTIKNTNEVQKVTMIDKILEIVKTDLVTGEELEGAELKVVDEEGNVIDEWTSSKEPHIVSGLEEGKKYKLIEVTAPYGYELTEEIEFEVTTDKETQRLEMKDMPILKDIRIVKIDKDTKEIIKSDFTFGIYEDENCTKLIKEVKSDKENGYVTFEDLRYGKYYIKEIEAPKGYKLSDKKIIVEINDNGVTIDGNLVQEAEKDLYSFDFENEKIETPNTGDNSNIGFWIKVLSISFILLAGIIVLGIKKLRK